jgi:hypothetical protein
VIDVLDAVARIRGFLCFTQAEVAASTGIPVYRLRKFEQGSAVLNHCECDVLRAFLGLKLKIVLEELGQHPGGNAQSERLSAAGP